MERFKVYNVKKRLSYFLIVFGGVLLTISFLIWINTNLTGSVFSNWNVLQFALQGSIFIFIGYWNLRSGKYFIEWDKEKINYLLPKSKDVESITIAEIKHISINLFEINLKFENAEKTIKLDNLQFEEIKKIKEKFEGIKMSVSKND